MALLYLELTQFRCFNQEQYHFSPSVNLISGLNSSGKSSLLEAIYFFGYGRPFRTSQAKRCIQHEFEQFVLHGHIHPPSSELIKAGIQRDKSGESIIKLNGEIIKSAAHLAQHFPIQLIEPDSHELLTGGPGNRRQFLDWGVFHVEHSFMEAWKAYSQALKQRNAALKSRLPKEHVSIWDNQLIQSAEIITDFRRKYLDLLAPVLSSLIKEISFLNNLTVNYHYGWDKKIDFKTALDSHLMRDRELGFTQTGPHRADIKFLINKYPIEEKLSRGQLKLLTYLLKLAQGKLLETQTNKNSIFLIDDLPAELDEKNRAVIANELINLNSQIFVTGIEQGELERLFINQHVNTIELNVSRETA